MVSEKDSVLFVDDEANVLLALQRLLRDEPYEVRLHDDPREALKEVLTSPPTVVCADYVMPQMTGPELLGQVKKINSGVVRMILTGRPDIQAVLGAVNDGEVYRFVLKPWDDDELRMLLRNAIDYSRLYREREDLLVRLEQQHNTIQSLERKHPGISKLPPRDESGAFLISEKDLPEGFE